MSNYISGEFPCTVDAKGRFLQPARFEKKQISKEQKNFIVVLRGFEST